MNRSTAHRLGDVALVLAVFAALTLLARIWAATEAASGDRSVFWSYLGLSASGASFPGFGAACAWCWMDEQRRVAVRMMLLVVFAGVALAVLGDAVLGSGDFGGGRAASLMQDAASLMLVAGGFTLLAGIRPTRDEPREV